VLKPYVIDADEHTMKKVSHQWRWDLLVCCDLAQTIKRAIWYLPTAQNKERVTPLQTPHRHAHSVRPHSKTFTKQTEH